MVHSLLALPWHENALNAPAAFAAASPQAQRAFLVQVVRSAVPEFIQNRRCVDELVAEFVAMDNADLREIIWVLGTLPATAGGHCEAEGV